MDTDWRQNLIQATPDVRALLERTQRIAVLGMKTEAQRYEPAFYIPERLLQIGFEVIPVPVYYPQVTHIMGLAVYRKLVDVPGEIDLVNVFRRPRDLYAHIDDLLEKRPRAVWFQVGCRNDLVTETLAKAGIQVVQDRCILVDVRSAGLRHREPQPALVPSG